MTQLLSKSDPLNGQLPSYFKLCNIYVRPNVLIQGCMCGGSNLVFLEQKKKEKLFILLQDR